MKHYVILLLLLVCGSLHAQDNLWNERHDILSEYDALAASDTNFRIRIVDSTSRITVFIEGKDSLQLTHFIRPYSNGIIDDESPCDSLVIALDCSRCAPEHIRKIIASKQRKWVQTSDSTYISKRWVMKFQPANHDPVTYTVPLLLIRTTVTQSEIVLYTAIFTKYEWKSRLRTKEKNQVN